MGISRDSIHKRRLTGGKQKKWRKKRKHELARQPSNTKIGPKRISMVRTRGGNFKNRALFLETGNFSYLSLRRLCLRISNHILKLFIYHNINI